MQSSQARRCGELSSSAAASQLDRGRSRTPARPTHSGRQPGSGAVLFGVLHTTGRSNACVFCAATCLRCASLFVCLACLRPHQRCTCCMPL